MAGNPWWILAPACALASALPAVAQESVEFHRVELRVVSARPGSATIDRGSIDGLARGDRVTFRPREGNAFHGTIGRIEERGALVDLDDPSSVPPPGTRGEVQVPISRLAVAAPPTPEPAVPPAGAPEHPPWEERQDDWTQDQPLLARVRPLRPAERPRTIHGRIYSIADFTSSTEDERTDGFYRLGSEVTIENQTGRGDRIHFEGELNHRHTDVPDDDDDRSSYLRLDRASYAVGGNRFQPSRFEVGRFLQDNLPELGLVDGAEWDRRLDNGDRIGFSAGFLPEPDPKQESVQDFQMAASYRWIHDASEQLTATVGIQKTLHDADADRDLLVAKVAYLPRSGFTFTSTAWVDYYTSGDAAKGSGVELTQAYVTTGRRWADGSSVHLVYSHQAFPEIDRDEFLPVTAQQLADDHNDRVALQSRVRISSPVRLHGSIAGWVDQDDSGTDGVIGIEFEDFFSSSTALDVSGFMTDGKFVEVLGARASLVRLTDFGRWSVEYELANNRLDGFAGDNNDLPQHRLRLGADWFTAAGWAISTHLDGYLWDDENAVTLGFYLQKSF